MIINTHDKNSGRCGKVSTSFIRSHILSPICNHNNFGRKFYSILLFAVLLLFFEINNLYAQVYYVSTSGKDANLGSFDNPLRTIKKALSITNGGDSIIIRGGTYTEGRVDVTGKTTSQERPLSITNYEEEKVIVDHEGTTYAWFIENQSYLIIKGITIQNAKEGFVILGKSRNNIFKNCIIRDFTNRGFFVHGRGYHGYPEDTLIDNNDFYGIGSDTAGADIALGFNVTNFTISNNKLHGNVDGIMMAASSSGHIIEHNNIFDHNFEDGIDLKNVYKRTNTARSKYVIIRGNTISGNSNQTGITIQQGSRNINIYENKIYNNKWGIWINDSETSDITIQQNSIYHNSILGIVINQNAKGNVRIAYNKIYNNGHKNLLQKPAGVSIQAGANYTIKNNIIANNSSSEKGYQLQVMIGENQVSSTTIKDNKYYLVNGTKIIKWGEKYYTLEQFKQNSGQGGNSIFIKNNYSPPFVNGSEDN